jgi:hypothetical protein
MLFVLQMNQACGQHYGLCVPSFNPIASYGGIYPSIQHTGTIQPIKHLTLICKLLMSCELQSLHHMLTAHELIMGPFSCTLCLFTEAKHIARAY